MYEDGRRRPSSACRSAASCVDRRAPPCKTRAAARRSTPERARRPTSCPDRRRGVVAGTGRTSGFAHRPAQQYRAGGRSRLRAIVCQRIEDAADAPASPASTGQVSTSRPLPAQSGTLPSAAGTEPLRNVGRRFESTSRSGRRCRPRRGHWRSTQSIRAPCGRPATRSHASTQSRTRAWSADQVLLDRPAERQGTSGQTPSPGARDEPAPMLTREAQSRAPGEPAQATASALFSCRSPPDKRSRDCAFVVFDLARLRVLAVL